MTIITISHETADHTDRADKQRASRQDLLMTTLNPRQKIAAALGGLFIAFAAAMPLAGATEGERSVPLTATEQSVDFQSSAPVAADPTPGLAQVRQFDADAGGSIVSALVADSADRPTLNMVVFFTWPKWKAHLFEQRLRGACGENVPMRDCVHALRELYRDLIDLQDEIDHERWTNLASAYAQAVQAAEEKYRVCLNVPRFANASAANQCRSVTNQCR